MAEMQNLDRGECLRLLASNRFGRLGVDVGGQGPTIRPVNYLFDEPTQSIVFRTGEGAKLYGLLATRKAAFEIDGIDLEARTGWSVLVRGLVEEIVDAREVDRLSHTPLDPWDPAEKPRLIRIRAWTVTGRRIAEPEAFEEASVVSRSRPVG